MNFIFNYETTTIVIARYKEPTDWVTKLDKFNKVLIYEKENPDKEPHNIPKNKGNEASAYLRYIIDNYDNLPKHVVLIHCHDESWHHYGEITKLLDTYINKEIEFENLNKKDAGFDMGNYQNWKSGELGDFYSNLIEPAVGNSDLYPEFTLGENGCAQFILHKSRILLHSKKFYENIYNWILEIDLTYYNHGYYLEWTWHLFWDKFIKNTYVKKYENESILYIIQLDKKYNFVSDITKMVNENLTDNNYYKIENKAKLVILKGDNTIREELIDNNFIYNKYI
jgi:hypothetical protein